jgi:hypothetical protein
MTNEEAEKIINEVFPGLTLFYRDTNLDVSLIEKYVAGKMLLEPAFTDCTYHGGGLTGNVRYLIASSKAAELAKLQPEVQKYGMMVLNAGAFFKVLDVYEIDGNYQILLLHIPNHTVDFFRLVKTNIEQTVIDKCRVLFEMRVTQEPIAVLQEEDWKSRIDFPLGISKSGKYYLED